MNRSNKPTIWSALVLTCGLVSCAPDNKKTSKDVYRAPVPLILKGAQSIDLRGWDRTAQKDLDIQDGFDVRASGAATVEVISRCRRGDGDLIRTASLAGTEAIRLYQLVPLELVAHDFAAAPVNCSFELTLRNQAGSKHIYNIGYASIKDERAGSAALEIQGAPAPQARQRFNVAALDAIKFRSNKNSSGQAQLLCSDGFSPVLNFDSVTALSNFDFQKMQPFQAREAGVLQRKPIQLCRATVFQNGVLQALTSLFEVQLLREPLLATILARGFGPEISPALSGDPVKGKRAELLQFRVQNPMAILRTVRVPKALVAKIRAYTSDSGSSHGHAPFILVAPQPSPNVHIKEEAATFAITIGPGTVVQINVAFQPPRPLRCAGSAAYRLGGYDHSAVIEMPPVIVEEVNDSNVVLDKIIIDPGSRFYFGIGPLEEQKMGVIPGGGACNWN